MFLTSLALVFNNLTNIMRWVEIVLLAVIWLFLSLITRTFSFLVQIRQALYSETLSNFHVRIKGISFIFINGDELHRFDSYVVQLRELNLQIAKTIRSINGILESTGSAGRSQWPLRLRRGSAAARLLVLQVRIPPGSWMSVSC